jgi:hypothetical protein
MKYISIIAGLLFIWNNIQAQKCELAPADFGIKASVYVKKLCEFGERTAGSIAERKTTNYLIEEFKMNGMNVKIDTIRYRFYHLNNRSLYFNNLKVPIRAAFISDPISDTIKFESYCVKIINGEDRGGLLNKVVFTSSSINSLILNKYKPKAIIVIDSKVLDTLRINETVKYSIAFIGHLESDWIQSYNIIATYNHNFVNDSTIILTAHWDTDNGVGAGDNASGTAALIELSKFFSTRLRDLKYNITFIATGAEEPGLIGSISYVLNHTKELDHCLFNLNIDDISYEKSYIETSNIRGNSTKSDTSQTLTIVSDKVQRGNLFTSFMELWGNHSENLNSIIWLRHKFEKSMSALKYDFQDGGCCSGVDSRAFDYANIPYISITSTSSNSNDDNANTPKDVYNDTFIENINRNGKIISKILMDINK